LHEHGNLKTSGVKMTNEQRELVKTAQSSFIAALDAGVDEDLLIDEVFDASNERGSQID
jgi:hypothetical protein